MPPLPLILIVDDDPTFRDVVSLRLRNVGYATAGAGDGARGMELARRLRPALVLLDLGMPRVDGLAFLGMLRADPALRATPVIVVSALSAAASVRRALELEVRDYLLKGTFSLSELVALVAGLAGPPEAAAVAA